MIEVRNLSKYYGAFSAIENISFDITKSEIVGFLGPNGAGKTTTMKILTCFMRPTSGSVTIGGVDIYDNSLEIKRKIGYLPENNPLYYDMTVREYLSYIAAIKEISKSEIGSAVNTVSQKCALNDVLGKKIGTLSKGYKQRVGISQAIITNPQILILDEPTSGLDPNQIVEIRELIKELGKEKTVILSTHILSEVETTCNRLIIINNGKIVADGTKDDIAKDNKDKWEIILTVKSDEVEDVKSKLLSTHGVIGIKDIVKIENGIFSFKVESIPQNIAIESIFALCSANNFIIYEFKRVEHSLEEIFKQLTVE